MSDNVDRPGDASDDMSDYLQTFLDETDEQLDDLVETMLSLEKDVENESDLNEAFRLIHSIKGSAGMMGFDNISVLTHHLENRFERFRSRAEQLDERTMDLVLRCIDFLRQCNDRLRNGQPLAGATELLAELKHLEAASAAKTRDAGTMDSTETAAEPSVVRASPRVAETTEPGVVALQIGFRDGLQLADLKARLIVTRLGKIGAIRSTSPDLDALGESDDLTQLTIRIVYDGDVDRLRAAADVDGVESIAFAEPAPAEAHPLEQPLEDAQQESGHDADQGAGAEELQFAGVPEEDEAADNEAMRADDASVTTETPRETEPRESPRADDTSETPAPPIENVAAQAAPKVVETMRIETDRIDNLMNLAGELVVNRARLVQISNRVDPALRKTTKGNRVRDLIEQLNHAIAAFTVDGESGESNNRSALLQQLTSGLDQLEEQAVIWENGQQCLTEMGAAIDQLTRVSHNLQRGVLDTRMAPVGPLFNRFKRVIRDLSKDRGKKVHLHIRGEKTELDKRMIDELGDPLVHLVRNSIDHGLEFPEIREARGKPTVGSITLEAHHSGNNVFIRVSDDGGGIDVSRIKAKAVEKGILSANAAESIGDAEALNYIWHPGFSTAEQVTDVSGRGVGMDVVKTRIGLLNGTIDVDSELEKGTTFTLRLPLTLAIIDCLMVRLRGVVFSIPIDDVREIVSVAPNQIQRVQGKRVFDVRGEFLPMVSVDEVFHWHNVDYGRRRTNETGRADDGPVDVVILTAAGKSVGLLVEELLGSQDIVIKSLSDNFQNIRGLSGASILGDGAVSLMLDVGRFVDLSTGVRQSTNGDLSS